MDEHNEILQALSTGDATAAMITMRKHIESGWTVLKASALETGGQ